MSGPDLSGRVLVLAGGLSHEREVSIRSGRRVADALRDAGVDVDVCDLDARLVDALHADRPACVLPLLHGEAGEDGSVREVLSLLGLPYVGAVPSACRLAFDKPVAKTVVERVGVDSPPGVALPHETFREIGAGAVMQALVDRLGLPLVVKPARGGSALGCSVVRDLTALPGAMVGAFSYGPVALVERFVTGTEVAVTVLERGGEPQALLPVEIRPDSGVYDYSARYTAGATEFVVPATLSPSVAKRCADVAVAAHRALGLRDLSRSDLVVDGDGAVWFLEVNVSPGMTQTSLVPLALEAAGLDLGAVALELVLTATRREQQLRG